jgi:hypothetical protein
VGRGYSVRVPVPSLRDESKRKRRVGVFDEAEEI